MKVLLAHNYYRSSAPSGEDAVFRNERDMLAKRGEVIVYEKHNDDIDESTLSKKIRLALNGAWSQSTYLELSKLLRETKPDVAHFHNTFPQISPSAYAACHALGIPVVQTLHNFRLVCPNALLLRDGKPCEDCLSGSLLPALRFRCYRGSLLATSALVWGITSNRWRGTYTNMVDRYIALSDVAAKKLIKGGLPSAKMEIKPNFLPQVPDVGAGRGGYAVYVGRLSEEKGVVTLLEAWRGLDMPLMVVGDGPLRSQLEQIVAQDQLRVQFFGFQPRDRVLDIIGKAEFQIVPSEWYETFGMVVLEAYACGTPVIASRIGSLEELVQDGLTGLHFEAGNSRALRACVLALKEDEERKSVMRVNARKIFSENFSEDQNFELLTAIYRRAITSRADESREQ